MGSTGWAEIYFKFSAPMFTASECVVPRTTRHLLLLLRGREMNQAKKIDG